MYTNMRFIRSIVAVVIASTFSCCLSSSTAVPISASNGEVGHDVTNLETSQNLLEQVTALRNQVAELEERLKNNDIGSKRPIDEGAIDSINEVHTSDDIENNVAKSHRGVKDGLSLRELLLIKAIIDEDMESVLPTTRNSQLEDAADDNDDQFDPVFGKLRDFLDSVTSDDLERAISKVHNLGDKETGSTGQNLPKQNLNLQVQKQQNTDVATIEDKGPCQRVFDIATLQTETAIGVNIPLCDDEGFYRLKQCFGSVCYCVDKFGKATVGRAPVWEAEELTCTSQSGTDADDAMQTLRDLLSKTKYNTGADEVSEKAASFEPHRGKRITDGSDDDPR